MTPRLQQRTTRILIVLLSLVIVGSIAAVIPWNNSDNQPKAKATIAPNVDLDAGGTHLASLLTGARDHTFHARYAVTGSPELLGGKLDLEWWNTKKHSRIDTTRKSNGQVVRTVSIVNGADGASCKRIDDGAWTCQKIAVPAPGDPGGIVTNLTAQLTGRPVSEQPGKVRGRSATCFHVGGGTEPIDVCTNADGVMLRNASAKVTYEVTTLDTAVPDAIFKPPAPVS
jgi:hypothetical protein